MKQQNFHISVVNKISVGIMNDNFNISTIISSVFQREKHCNESTSENDIINCYIAL